MPFKFLVLAVLQISLLANCVLARPAPQDLQQRTGAIQNGMEWLGRMADKIRLGRGKLVNSAIIARNIMAERVENFISDTRNNLAGAIGGVNDLLANAQTKSVSYERAPFASWLPPRTRENARLESEVGQALLERRDPKYPQRILQDYLHPTPLVDRIEREEDKYGNTGEQFSRAGKVLVTSVEGFGNFIDRLTRFPVGPAEQLSRKVTEALNQLGSRLVGLQ